MNRITTIKALMALLGAGCATGRAPSSGATGQKNVATIVKKDGAQLKGEIRWLPSKQSYRIQNNSGVFVVPAKEVKQVRMKQTVRTRPVSTNTLSPEQIEYIRKHYEINPIEYRAVD